MAKLIAERVNPAEVGRILVIDLALLGDIVTLEPALRLIRAYFPAAKIDAVANPISGELLKLMPQIERVISWDKRGADRGTAGFFRVARRIREDYDLAIIFHNSIGSALLSFVVGVPWRVGYTSELRGPLLTPPVPLPEQNLHLIDQRLHLLREVGIPGEPDPPHPRLPMDHRKAREWLEERAPVDGAGKPKLLIPLSAGYGTKSWPPENIERFMNLFPEETVCFVLTGVEKDREKLAGIFSYRNPVIDLVGKTSVRELVMAVAGSDLVVSPDTGPMHIAAAVGVPVIALFGPTDPELCGARGERVIILQAEMKCVRCYKKQCNFNPFCMRDALTPELVFRVARKLLAENANLSPVEEARAGVKPN